MTDDVDERTQAGDVAAADEAGDRNGSPETAERNTEDMSILEAAIFASNEVLSAARLKEVLPGHPDARAIRKLVSEVNQKLQKERHPFEIAEIGGGFQFRTVAYYQPWVQQVFRERASRRLSIQSLECLAIVAYRQPITRIDIDAIRGVASEGAMKTLLEKRLVTIAGRSDKPGRPLLYATTPFFLQYFGLNKLSDLPKMEEFEAMAREKMDDLSEEELERIEELAGGVPAAADEQEGAAGESADAAGSDAEAEATPADAAPGHDGQKDGAAAPGETAPDAPQAQT